jgi:hypothetical protein
MTDRSGRLAKLKVQNPFAAVSAGAPGRTPLPDVPDVNRRAFEVVANLIREQQARPDAHLAGLILGEVGEGKTHILNRIAAHGRAARPPYIVAYVEPIENPDRPFSYLLREVTVPLLRPEPGTGVTPLDAVAGQIYAEVITAACQHLGDGRFTPFLKTLEEQPAAIRHYRLSRSTRDAVIRRAEHLLRGEHPELSGALIRCLLHFPHSPVRRPAADWLMGEIIDRSDADQLGVSPGTDSSDGSREAFRRDLLRSLGILLARYRQIVVVAFDRLENLVTSARIAAFGRMVELLVDSVAGMVPIVCARGGQWESDLRNRLNQHVVTRLEANTAPLSGCTPTEALSIIAGRLAAVFGETESDDLFPFDRTELAAELAGEMESPREVLITANRRLRSVLDTQSGVPAEEPGESGLAEAWASAVSDVTADLDGHPPDRDRLRRAVRLLLTHADEALGIEAVRDADDRHIDLLFTFRAGGPERPMAILIDTAPHHLAVTAALRKGIGFLEDHPDGRAIYLRDARCPVPSRWTGTNALLNDFTDAGGAACFLPPETAGRLLALTSLIYSVGSGDVLLTEADGTVRPASEDDLGRFIESSLQLGRAAVWAEIATAMGADPAPDREASVSNR